MGALTLERLRHESNGEVYPRDRLADCEDALVLFGAGFLGAYDSIWLYDAELAGTVVDQDADNLASMEELYPGWMFFQADAYEYAAAEAALSSSWDVVSLDGWTDQSDRNYELLPLWCSLARKLVVLNVCRQTIDARPLILDAAPAGWHVTGLTPRTSAFTSHWLVLEAA